MKHTLTIAFALCLSLSAAMADEGMWLLGNLRKDKRTERTMKELGLKLPTKNLYNPGKPALADAVVSFGGFCSGVVVSADGLVFTNHHCGFSHIRQHSTVERDYLKDGFVARSRAEELPNPGLYVRFLLRTEEVTDRVLAAVRPAAPEAERAEAIDSVMTVIAAEVSRQDSTQIGVVDAYYAGNEFWLSVYRDYTDVRLVFAPPSSVGKFGWDTDNWMWPRHTGDFSVFRIYADADNRPADYAPTNVPYRPVSVAPISLEGYREGDFCLTLGYPGSTERHLSSYGIEERMQGRNQAMIDMRTIKQAIWKQEMERRPDIRLKYASKYDESSNYWKNSIGMNRALQHRGVLQKKRKAEEALRTWMLARPAEREQMTHLFPALHLGYGNRRPTNRALAYFTEAFLNGPELVQVALEILNFDFEAEPRQVEEQLRLLMERYANLDAEIDQEVFAAMLQAYRTQVDAVYLPPVYATIDSLYAGDAQAYAGVLYASSRITSPQGLQLFLQQDTTYNLVEDPAVALSLDLLVKYYELNLQMAEASEQVEQGERLFNAAMRRMYADRHYYPDANGTMRLSFGTVRGYTPADGTRYAHRTTVRGILEKVRAHAGGTDFAVQPELLSLLAAGDFGRYANEEGGMNVCFVSDNDITGGNSGSAMFNDRGQLLGLAFDGNWEAMSGDVLFEPTVQRCIGVDIRYILFLMQEYAGAHHLVGELQVVRPPQG